MNDGVTFIDAKVAADVEWLDACSYALEDVRPSVEGVNGHFEVSLGVNQRAS